MSARLLPLVIMMTLLGVASGHARALESETIVLERATTSSKGRERIDHRCRHCDHQDTEYRTTPKESKSSSSSSSSSSSFRGGSTSGGGASGS